MQSSSIILASSSPRRRELLHTLGMPFTVITSDVDETVEPNLTPAEVVEQLSLKKARAVAGKVKAGLVIGADTIVVLNGKILGKPADETDAFAMLSSLQGQEHTVYSGVAMIDVESMRSEVEISFTKVKMQALTANEINRYIATKEPMDKAGAYAIQGFGATIVEGIVGDYFTVVGLPLRLTAGMLARFGIRLF